MSEIVEAIKDLKMLLFWAWLTLVGLLMFNMRYLIEIKNILKGEDD